MKKISINLLTNVMLLLAGLIFLLFYHTPHILDWVARIIGALFLLPSIVFLLVISLRKSQPSRTSDYMGVLPALGGMCFGVVMLIRPALFNSVLVLLLGVFLSILGLFHIFFLMLSYKRVNAKGWYFISPFLVLAAGIVVLFVETVSLDENMVVLITGISLLLFNFTSFQEYLGEKKNRSIVTDVETEVATDKPTDIEL